MDRSPWEAALGGIVGAVSSMALTAWALALAAHRLDAPTDAADAIGRILGAILILGYSLFAAGIIGAVIGSAVALRLFGRDRIFSTVAIMLGMETVAVPLGVAMTLYSQDLPIGDMSFVASIALIVAVVPFAARAFNVRRTAPSA